MGYTLKTPGSEIDPERVHWGQTPFRVNDDPEISQHDAECDPELGQSDRIICQVCRKLTNFRVSFDPEWSLAPMDPFPGHADPGVFKVYGSGLCYDLCFVLNSRSMCRRNNGRRNKTGTNKCALTEDRHIQ